MARCPSCEADNPDGLKFCGNCGANLAAKCAACGSVNPPSFKFCGDCGAKLSPTYTSGQTGTITGSQPATSRDAERRQLTVVFCDLADSTELADRLDPEELRDVIREYQSTAATIFQSFGGYIAQYLGDGLLVYFGYPQAHEDDPRRAVHASLDVVAGVQALSARLQTERKVALAVRIGIHTGPVVAGDVGEGDTRERLALGSTPNIAARLQAIAGRNVVLLSGATRAFVERWFDLESLGEQTLKGVTKPVEAYLAVRRVSESGQFELDAARHLTPIVGRDEEITLLNRRLESVRKGAGHLVLLTGEAGVGKSRLVQVVRERATTTGFSVLLCRCASVYENSPLHPIADLVERALGFEREDSPETRLQKIERALARLSLSLADDVPPIAGLLSVPTGTRYAPPSALPHRAKARLFEVLLSLLHKMAEAGPTLFILEDAHWADPSTLEFLAQFANQPPQKRLLAVVTIRREHSLAWQTRGDITLVTLHRLADADISTMIESMMGDRSFPAAMRKQIIEKAGGVPVFAEELTKTLLEAGFGGDRPLDTTTLATMIAVPATLQDSLLARLDRMGDAKEVAQLGAVIGREFGFEMLCEVSRQPAEYLSAQLERLVAAELLYQRGASPTATYTFKHALIQDAAYALLLKSSRREYHRRTAEALQQKFGDLAATHPELLAHHLTEAGQAPQAIGAWINAGIHALRRSANQEAIVQLRRGIALLAEIPEGPMRDGMELGLLATIGPAYSATRSYASPESKETYARACEICERMPDAPELFWAVRGLWVAYHSSGDLEKALELAERCERIAELTSTPEILMEAHWAMADTQLFRGHLPDAKHWFDAILALDYPNRDRSTILYTAFDIIAAAESLYAQLAWLMGDTEGARRHGRLAVSAAENARQPLSLTLALYHAGWVEYAAGNREEVRRLMHEVIRLCDENGMVLEPPARMYLAWADNDAAAYEAAFQKLAQAGTYIGQTYFLGTLAEIHFSQGRFAQAREVVDRALAAGERAGEHIWDAELHRLLGEIARATGRAAEAEPAFKRALAIAEQQGAAALAERARNSLTSAGAMAL